ncbi:MAG: DNA/RNA nuclease SfsA [Candidatus Paracaedimonas acanthamoebae]|uniref:Sugar fermentation stimulation protein homolog n=1 Tax=Candidatus Paracaedimonas acanthamoebae TaxID=244581 RepID=A0A8J7TUH3_9PROT|nr:DNA/RNA nuclease SfsA [Candidatus Paracaedimonas acanthamoebae]
MKFSTTLLEGILLKRYKRFLADVRLAGGQEVTAHCPNPGAMLDVASPGLSIWLTSYPPESPRKLKYTWELVKHNDVLIGVNTMHPNNIVEEALKEKKIPEFSSYTTWRREVKYGTNSRIDFILEGPNLPPCYLEVKNVHLKRDDYVQFPDSVTLRGTKHLKELEAMKKQGARAIVLYVVQREDCTRFKPAKIIDPLYAITAYNAMLQGVETLCYNCRVTPEEIILNQPITVEL